MSLYNFPPPQASRTLGTPITSLKIYNGWKLFLKRKVVFSVYRHERPDAVSEQ